MQTEIHPEYVECKVHCSCGNEFTTRSTLPTLRVELCSECHPFYTGKQKLVDTGGRVERFQRRYAKKKPAAPKTAERGADMPEPRYMGGQAVLEGVMMRGANTWAIAVRTPDGDINVDVREAPGWGDKYRNVPVLRGVMGLAESLGLGYRALTWSANQQVAEEDRISEKALGWAILPALIFFSAVFIVIPAFVGHGVSNWVHGSFPVAEGLVRLALFIGYLGAVGQLKEIRRVFQYHGAEHKAIAAYENDVELTPEAAQQFSTAHVRCGTNFLLTVMVVAVFVYSFVPRPNLWFVIASRIVLMPLIAGLSYEVIRYFAKNMRRPWVRVVSRPGLWLQRLTTREPDLSQLEVAITSLRAVMTAEQTAEVDARVGRLVPAIAPAV